MLTLSIKLVKFSEEVTASGEVFTKIIHKISLPAGGNVSSIIDALRESWSKDYPTMISFLDTENDLKLMLKSKTLQWSSTIASYKIPDGSTLLLMHKNPLKKPLAAVPIDVEMKNGTTDDQKDASKPILDRVSIDEVDKSALNQLLMLGYEKEISIIALKHVGTEYGSLGYDGLNKAIDYINRRKKDEEEKFIKNSKMVVDEDLEAEVEKMLKKEEYLDFKRKVSMEAKERYKAMHDKVHQSRTNLSMSTDEYINCYSFGKGSKGQLALGIDTLMTAYPTKIRSLLGVRVSKVACGPRNTLFLSDDNRLFKTEMVNCLPVRLFEQELEHERLIDLA